ncbi:MAG: RIP metalloprotease RseP [Nitrospinae bacterium]|nr:RIP metalloprotease RseP [Nitrospinota bacterium]
MNFFSKLATASLDQLGDWLNFGMSAVAVLAALIVAHEFGHYIIARILGVRVEKFSVGFGPRIFGKKIGDTEYLLSWIPLGGYVKLYGDDPTALPEDLKGSFLTQPVWKRLMIVAAGPVFNIFLAVGIVTTAAMIGLPEITNTIGEVQKGSPAEVGGLMPGDEILSIDGVSVSTWKESVALIQTQPGQDIIFTLMRDGQKVFKRAKAIKKETKSLTGEKVVVGQVGILPYHKIVSYPVHVAFYKGLKWTWDITTLTAWSIGKLVTRDIPADQIAGPIGIMKMAGDVAESGFVSLLMFIALISINLGILNLLPVPILDGGHIFFFTLEALMGRPVQLKHQEIAQQVGMFLLISLMALALYNDIMRLIAG